MISAMIDLTLPNASAQVTFDTSADLSDSVDNFLVETKGWKIDYVFSKMLKFPLTVQLGFDHESDVVTLYDVTAHLKQDQLRRLLKSIWAAGYAGGVRSEASRAEWAKTVTEDGPYTRPRTINNPYRDPT